MREIAIAFPNDETTAEVIASRLRAEGLPARVDRGLWGGYQVPLARGQLTVLVPERDAARAHEVLGTHALEERGPGLLLWATVGFVVLVLGFSIAAVVLTVAR